MQTAMPFLSATRYVERLKEGVTTAWVGLEKSFSTGSNPQLAFADVETN